MAEPLFASQEDYIDVSIACCKAVFYPKTIGSIILLKKDKGLRLALLAFRDHHLNDDYLVKDFGGFTGEVDTILSNLKTLRASGGWNRS